MEVFEDDFQDYFQLTKEIDELLNKVDIQFEWLNIAENLKEAIDTTDSNLKSLEETFQSLDNKKPFADKEKPLPTLRQ